MSDVTLGRFGDRRLEKGGPFCMPVWWRRVGVGCGFVGLGATGWTIRPPWRPRRKAPADGAIMVDAQEMEGAAVRVRGKLAKIVVRASYGG
jgi:hypothetical protein